MTPIILAALLSEYTTQLEAQLYNLNAQEPPPKKRVWVKLPKVNSNLPSPNWNILPPTRDTPGELWEWVDDTSYIQPKYRVLVQVVERMKEFTESLKKGGTDVKSENE